MVTVMKMFQYDKNIDLNYQKKDYLNNLNLICKYISYEEYKALYSLITNKEISKEEFLTLCYLHKDIYEECKDESLCDIYDNLIAFVEKIIYSIINGYNFEKIDDSDPNYPNNLYHTGYKYDDIEIYDCYTGMAGRYWNTLFK